MLLTLLACNGPSSDDSTPTDQPTYYEDVAPILAESCWSCHQAGEIAPFSLTSYEDTRLVAASVAASVSARRMPPWLATDDGSCNDYQHSVWLEEEEIATIVAWAEGSQLEGDPANAPDLPAPEGSLDDYTHTLSIGDVYLPDFADQQDDYRCFIVDPGIVNDGYVAGYEIVAGNPEIVHHVIVYVPDSASALADAYAKDDASPGDGYPCFGDGGVSSYMSALWAPGKNVWRYPEGTGVPVEAGMPHIVQVHYNDTGSEQGDDTEVRYEVVDEVDGVLYPWFYINSSIAIPPDEEAWVETQSMKLGNYIGPYSFDLVGVGPHMHQLGSALRASATVDGEEVCLIDVPRWDFNWQMPYMFDQSIPMDKDTKLTLECEYDSRGMDETVHWGDGTQDEMCLLTMYSVFY